MGWMCSWIAVKGVAKADLLQELGLEETGEAVEPGSRRRGMCVGEKPDGWIVLFNENAEWASEDRVRDLSRFGQAVGLQFEDKVQMTSIVWVADGGVSLWSVSHVNDPVYNLEVTGRPPAEFDAIRDQYFQEQDEDGGEDSSADYVHEIPIELAKSVCGYRADEQSEVFVALRGLGVESDDEPPRAKLGFLARLLAPLRRPRGAP